MRVLHVIPSVADRYGGPTVAVRGMTDALADLGADVTIATTDADGPRARLDVPVGRPVRLGGVEYRHFARTGAGEWKFSWPLTRWLWRHARDYDVVHVHALFSYSTIPGCRAAARAGVPYVLRPLGTLGAWGLAQRSWKKRPYLALVEHRHLTRAAALHLTSDAERAGVEALGYGANARVIPLGVALPTHARGAAREGPDDELRLLFLSRLHPGKRLPIVIEALAMLTPSEVARIELVVAGDGAPSYVAELRALVARLGLGDRVRFVGHVDGAAKAELLASANLFVLPSDHENFGIAAAEALAAGLPVIVSDQVGLAGEVAEARAGIVVPREAGAIAEALRSFLAAPAARVAMGARAAVLAAERWSWRRTARELLALYEELKGKVPGVARAG